MQGQIREFVETEKERVDKRKSTIVKSERERKASGAQEVWSGLSGEWQGRFATLFLSHRGKLTPQQIKLPFPEELLPIIARTPEKQREVQERIKASQSKEANGSQEKQATAAAASPAKTISPQPVTKADVPKPGRSPITMRIQEIPPFSPRKPPTVVIPPTATAPVPKAVPEEMAAEAPRAKLNPTASSFVFKPNVAAPRFQPVRDSHLRQKRFLVRLTTSGFSSQQQSEISQGPSTSRQPDVLPSAVEQKRLQSPPSSSVPVSRPVLI